MPPPPPLPPPPPMPWQTRLHVHILALGQFLSLPHSAHAPHRPSDQSGPSRLRSAVFPRRLPETTPRFHVVSNSRPLRGPLISRKTIIAPPRRTKGGKNKKRKKISLVAKGRTTARGRLTPSSKAPVFRLQLADKPPTLHVGLVVEAAPALGAFADGRRRSHPGLRARLVQRAHG